MLSALNHSSISSTSSVDNASSTDPTPQKTASAATTHKISALGNDDRPLSHPHDCGNEPGGLVRTSSPHNHHNLDYVVDAPVHPLAATPSPHPYSPKSRPRQRSPSMPSVGSFQPQQHQQLVKLKSEHRYPPSPMQQHLGTPDIVMTDEDAETYMESDQPILSPVTAHMESMEDGSHHLPSHISYQEKAHLAVDTSPGASSGRPSPTTTSTSPMTASTPTIASINPDSGTTAPSSRRSSLRTMTATLPRSALQEETIALFKQYRNLIPCAKCFSRNTIQRDGMSDGNLRFKCRPPVSMSLICNKSYSESKIRNMIAGVVYGHTLPDSGTPTSGSSENVLAFAPPPLPKSPRRPSLKDDLSELARESSAGSEHQQSFEEMNINGGHPHPIDDRRSPHGDMTRRPSAQLLCRRPTSAGGEDSPMMDYEDSTMPPPSSHLQVPGTPPLEGDDPRLYRPHFTHPPRSVTPTAPSTASGSLSAATRQGQKLQHSHSHPNIGQKRHQQFLEQREQQRANHAYSSQSPQYYAQQQQQQRHLQRQVMRRESTQYYNAAHSRPVTAERRFSHPAALQPSSSVRFLSRSHSGDGNSPAISSRSPPNYESLHQALGQANTPQVGSVSGLGNRFEDVNSPSYYQRRMSQPHPSFQRSYSQLPPPPPGATAHPHDRHTSGTEDFNYQHRQKYEKLNANTIRPPTALSTGSKMYMTPHSSQVLNSECSTLSTQNLMFQSTHSAQSEPMRFSQSLPVSSHEPNHHVYSRQPSRENMDSSEPYAPETLVHEETDNHPYSGKRHGHQKSNTGHSLARMRSQPNLSKSNHTSARDLDAAIARNTIKLTCFPNTVSSSNAADRSSVSLDTSDAMAMQLGQSSKVVIEITQPRQLQVFKPSRSASFASFEHVPGPLNERKSLRHTASQPNLLMRSGTSVLGRRRSASPDGVAFGSSKKRRADSTSRSRDEDDGCSSEIPSASASAAAASAAAAAVVAAAANAARQQQQQTGIKKGSSSAAQLASLDHDALEKALGGSHQAGLGLGVHVSGTESMLEFPAIETLKIANISSFVALEDQKDLGIDCSLFTRVETAAWRILIPPNVEASFRSEDFGLTLRPKLVDSVAAADVPEEPTDIAKFQGAQVAIETDDVEVRIDDGGKREVEKEARTVAGRPDATELSEQREANDQDSTALKSVSETEEEMDELEDE